MSESDTNPECVIKDCSREASREELWKNGVWYQYCDEHESIGSDTDEVVEVTHIKCVTESYKHT